MSFEPQYVDRNAATASYRPKGYGVSPGLKRARRPFLLSNIVTGGIITLFVVGVWAYSIRAVRQDVFDDVDAEAKALTGEMKKAVETVEERTRKVEEKLKAIAGERLAKSTGSSKAITNKLAQTALDGKIGVLPVLYPNWYGPSKSLIWGAPPVDNLGRIGDRRNSD